MALDTFINFGDAEVSTGYDAAATSVVLTAGHGARWASLTVPYNATWWNYTDYPNATDDPNREIVRVTARSTDTLTVTRGQESISATTKNAGGKTYRMLPTLTAKTLTDIDTALGATFVTTSTNAVLSNESVLTGTSNQVVVTGATLSTPQDIHTGADIRFDSIGLGVAADGTSGSIKHATNLAGRSASWYVYDASADNTGLELWPDGVAGKSYVIFGRGATTGDTAPDRNQTYLRLFAPTGANSSQGANYFNSIITLGATDGGSNVPRGFELGVEGNMSGGTFSENRFYLWQFDSAGANGNTVFAVDQITSPRQFRIPWPDSGEAGYMLRVGGANISTNADGIVGGLDVSPGAGGLGNYTKNDTNTRFFHHFQVKPEFNFGASNANATVAIANIDCTNTSLTGATIIPLRIAYGGTELARMSSGGNLGIGTQSPLVLFHGVSTTVSFLSDVWVASVQGAGSIARKGRGTASAPRRTQSGDDLGVYNTRGATAVDDSTAAVFSSENAGSFRFVAAEAFTTTAQGAYFSLGTITPGTTTSIDRLIVNQTGVQVGATAAARGTTQPTNAITLYNGTAPVGTLTNGCSIYSASGELLAMDAGGNVSNLTLPFTSTVQGVVPASGGSATHKFLTQAVTFASPVYCKSITVESPSAAEDISIAWTDDAITITKMVAVLVGSSTPSVTWTVRHGTDRSAAGAEVVTSGTTTTSTTTGSVVTAFNDATIVADSFVWLETTAQSGTVGQIQVNICYTID